MRKIKIDLFLSWESLKKSHITLMLVDNGSTDNIISLQTLLPVGLIVATQPHIQSFDQQLLGKITINTRFGDRRFWRLPGHTRGRGLQCAPRVSQNAPTIYIPGVHKYPLGGGWGTIATNIDPFLEIEAYYANALFYRAKIRSTDEDITISIAPNLPLQSSPNPWSSWIAKLLKLTTASKS